LLLVIASDGLQDAVANGDTRTLSIHHTHTKEDITVTFRRGGRYDDAGLAKLNHFLRDWRNDAETKMDPKLFDIVWEVYQEVGGKQPIQIISAYRSPATNAMLRRRSRGVAQFSQHMLGKAMDFNIPGVPLEQVRAAGLRVQSGGVGYYPSSGSPFVHLDVGSVRHWPRMTHDQLARVFPNGRTVHVPSNGQPLSGYALALADVERRGGSPSGTSLAAARGAGVDTASSDKSKPGLLARIFGAKDDEDEETAAPARPSRLASAMRAKATPEPESEPEKPAQVAAAIPLPRVRPLAIADRAEPAKSAAPTRTAALGVSAADVVAMRGLWTGSSMAAALNGAPEPTLPRGNRVITKPAQVAAAKPAPRAQLASAMPSDLTASIGAIAFGRAREELPSEFVMSYAATGSATQETTPAPRAAPMGTLRANAAPTTNATVVARTAPTRSRGARLPVGAPLAENPWLRGVIMSPSIHASMDVAATGRADPRGLVHFMKKPVSSVAMQFTDRPDLDLTTLTFSGKAVAFVPTVTFGTVTAGLN
jgi:uncharacterized protein YcbK (DUF882 family)